MAQSKLPVYLQEAAARWRLDQARLRAEKRSLTEHTFKEEVWEWGPKWFYLQDTADLIQLYPPQVRALKLARSTNAEGRFNYSTILWSWPKKSAKSTIIAMLADYICVNKPRASVTLVANDLKQADSRVGFYIREAIKLGARLGYGIDNEAQRMQQFRADTKITTSGYYIEYPNGSRITSVPVDPAGEAGGGLDDITVFSELWGWKSKAHQQMFTEMTISPTRFGYAQRWIDTYAGFEDASPVLWNVYEAVVSAQNRIDPDYEFYASDDLFATWVTQPLFPWQTPEYYASEEKLLDPPEFRRVHRNSWSRSQNAFGPVEWWESNQRLALPPDQQWNAYRVDYMPPFYDDEELILALDAGTDSDCFAIWAGTVKVRRRMRPEGTPSLDGSGEEEYLVGITRYTNAWYPKDYDKFTFDEPLEEVRRLCAKYNVVQLAYDPYQLKAVADQLDAEGITWVEEFPQQTERDIADKLLYDMIRQGRFWHHGHADFTQHYKNADKQTDGKRLRIVKRDAKLKIDLLVAASMGLKRAVDLISDIEDV